MKNVDNKDALKTESKMAEVEAVPDTLGYAELGTVAREAQGTLGPNLSARGPEASEACLHAFRSPLPELHLSEFYLFFR